MLLGDGSIRKLVDTGVIHGAKDENIGPVTYDLTTREFYSDGKPCPRITLSPGDSAFVGSEETIDLPDNLACRVLLRNSRIRQGLSLAAPLYFPGHKTRVFFRITNISSDSISLDSRKGIASIAFEDVEGVEHPYNGAFADEFDFSGMADYRDIYKDDIAKVERKARDIEGVEKRMYGNVIVLMGIFVGVFSLVNVNVMSMAEGVSSQFMIAMNLATVGSLSVLFALVSLMLRTDDDKRWPQVALACIIAIIAFVIAACIAL